MLVNNLDNVGSNADICAISALDLYIMVMSFRWNLVQYFLLSQQFGENEEVLKIIESNWKFESSFHSCLLCCL